MVVSRGDFFSGSMLKNGKPILSSALNDFGGGNGRMCQGLYQTNQGNGCAANKVLGAETAPLMAEIQPNSPVEGKVVYPPGD